MRRARDVIDNASSGPSDRLAAHAWSLHSRLVERARAILTTNIALAREFFSGHPELVLPEPPSCSVTFPRIAGVSDVALFTQTLLGHGVAVAPGWFFEAPAHFRISLAGRTETLQSGLELIGRHLRTQPA
jgi:aspartate/methionine/tyrosine aminotransferase